jgi:hypothetical protein
LDLLNSCLQNVAKPARIVRSVYWITLERKLQGGAEPVRRARVVNQRRVINWRDHDSIST